MKMTWRRVRAEIDVDLIALVSGVLLLVIAAWPWLHQGALLIPGVVLLWLALPPRTPFVRGAEPKPPTRRTS